jgi:hypothetical protein
MFKTREQLDVIKDQLKIIMGELENLESIIGKEDFMQPVDKSNEFYFAIEKLYPSNLFCYLNFFIAGEDVRIYALKFFSKTDFMILLEITKNKGGEYISNNTEYYFKIPKANLLKEA